MIEKSAIAKLIDGYVSIYEWAKDGNLIYQDSFDNAMLEVVAAREQLEELLTQQKIYLHMIAKLPPIETDAQ